MRDLKFRMLTQTTDKILGYIDIYDLLRNGSDVLPDFEEAVLEGVKFEQYTGLKDKNGKEIYEGDILGGVWEGGYIAWCDKCNQFQYHISTNECMACLGDVHWHELVEDDGELEVIGNIHENPELVGGE